MILPERYGDGRYLHQWSLDAEGRPVCLVDALDTVTASPAEIAAVEAANAAIRAELGLEAPPPEPVPASVTRFQARAALALAELLPAVEAAAAASPDPLVPIALADAAVFVRASPMIAALAADLNLSEAQVDDLFRAAAGITA